MKREQILFILGILIVLSPFYGLPERALTPITILLGFAVIFFSLSRRTQNTTTETTSTGISTGE